MKILVLNGPNLNLLGARDEKQYGNLTLTDIEQKLKSEFSSYTFEFYQSNIEGELIEKIQKGTLVYYKKEDYSGNCNKEENDN